MLCPYLAKHKDEYYICKISSELISRDRINGKICLSEEFKECFEYKREKRQEEIQEEIKDIQAFKKEGKDSV